MKRKGFLAVVGGLSVLFGIDPQNGKPTRKVIGYAPERPKAVRNDMVVGQSGVYTTGCFVSNTLAVNLDTKPKTRG